MHSPLTTVRNKLGKRIVFLVAQSMLLMLAALGLLSWLTVRETNERVLDERSAVAQATGAYLDFILRQNLKLLDDFRLAEGINLQDADLQPEQRQLHSMYVSSLFDSMFLTDAKGKLLLIEPPRPDILGSDFAAYAVVSDSLRFRKPLVSDVFTETSGRPVVMIVNPVHNYDGVIVGLVGGEIYPTRRGLQEFAHTTDLGPGSFIDIVDSRGLILASSDVKRILTNSSAYSKDEVTRMTALAVAPWSVAVRQSASQANAPLSTLRTRFLLFGAFALALAVLLSWSMARSLLRPLGQLTAAAKRIATGNLSEPVAQTGTDELGALAGSLDVMRLELKKSLEKIQDWNRDLEGKVKDRTARLEESYREIERHEAARGELLRKTLTVQEDERKRIARELHDDTIQSLVALLMRLDTAAAMPGETPEQRHARLNDIRNLAVKTIDSVHKMIFDLRPSVLDDLGLFSAIRWYAENRLSVLGVKTMVEVTGEERKLPSQTEIAIFRVAQEAISNVAKHAGAHNVVVGLELQDAAFNLEVEDDGKGFDPDAITLQADKGQGLGLLGMKERVSLLGGQFIVDSRPGEGARISVTIPLSG